MTRLVVAGFGYQDVLDMPWTEARTFAQLVERLERERILGAALAARAAQCDGKSWDEWVANMSTGR